MKLASVVVVAVVVLFLLTPPLFAQGAGAPAGGGTAAGNKLTNWGPGIGAGVGAALTLIGAGWGFGRIGAAALESMARQPEIAARIQTAMIVIAALLEGATFFSLIVCILLLGHSTVTP